MQIEKPTLTPEQSEIERALAALMPAAPAIDRDALMFAAGKAAARAEIQRPTLWPWQLAACLGFACALFLAIPTRPAPPQSPAMVATAPTHPLLHEPVAENPDPQNNSTLFALASVAFFPNNAPTGSPWSYHNLRNAVLTRGLDAIPPVPNGSAEGNAVIRTPDTRFLFLQHTLFLQGGPS